MKRRSRHSPPGRSPGRRDPAPPAAGPPGPALTPGRKLLFRLIAFLVIPLLLIGLLELVLRLAGYGYSTAFFQELRVNDREYLVNNPDFSRRFFPLQLARWPAPFMMETAKPPGCYRIFIFGESAAMGDPEPAYGPGRYLEALLRERHPGAGFEVVNVAITAINSHVIVPIARECAGREGDLWIVYMGNNEMVGPFGGATVFGAQAPPVWVVRMSLAVQATRVGQLLADLMSRFRSDAGAPSWGGMEMFLGNQVPPGDPRRERVYRNFQANLGDILEAGRRGGARVLLSTVAVNLKDCPPFVSLSNSNLPPADRAAADEAYARGRAAQEQGDFQGAAEQFEAAARRDAGMADAQFRWGQCLLQSSNLAAAREHFQIACDLDALVFRADSRVNRLIGEAGGRRSGPELAFVDAAAALDEGSPAGICGDETFYEHVHFNFAGSYRLARAWAERLEAWLPPSIRDRAGAEWASQETCERRLGLTDWNRVLVLKSVAERLSRPPLNSQPNNAPRLAALREQAEQAAQRTNAAAIEQARILYQEALLRAPEDHFIHESYAQFLELTGDVGQAAARWRIVHELLPQDCLADYQLGRALRLCGRRAEAEEALLRAVALRPPLTEAWIELGNVRFAGTNYEAAIEAYDRARRLRPGDPRIHLDIGRSLSLLKRSAESVASFREAIRLNPGFWEARYALGGELGMHGDIAGARAEFEQVTRLQPDFAMGHLNLGVALLKLGRPADARREFEETVRLDPANRLARQYLSQAKP